VVDVATQIAYWRAGAEEDWAVARELLDRGRVRHGLFLAHLALEKVLKAHVCRQTGELAPRIHNLVRLAELTAIELQQEHLDVLAEMNAFNVEGRYPGLLAPPTSGEARGYVVRAEGVFLWLMSLL